MPPVNNTMERINNIDYCLQYLMRQEGVEVEVPASLPDKRRLLRALMNVWEPQPLSEEFLAAQDAELQIQLEERGTVQLQGRGVTLWQGDITRLRVDAIVNAANSRMMGCWHPLHACIDNCIHSAAGLQLRAECAEAMSGTECPPVHPMYEMNGRIYREAFTNEALITRAYNLPCRHVIHTVGPIVPSGMPTSLQERQLADCYRNCFGLAVANGCHSIAFCCISTGEFRFPNRRAAEIAIETVREICNPDIAVVFNVFKDTDYVIYSELLGKN